MGGAVAAIEAHFMQEEIEQAAYAYAKAVDAGEKVVVGVNRFADDGRRARPTSSPSTPSSSGRRSPAVKSVRAGAATRPRSTPPWPTSRRPPGVPRTCSCR